MPTLIDNSEYSGTRNIGTYSVNGILSVSRTEPIYVNYDGQLARGNYDANAVTGGVQIGF
jgi:hypothetical protein